MKNDKSEKHPATSATSATQEAGLTSLLGVPIEPDDPLAFAGLGVGATQRAKDLVLLGLECERQEALKAFSKNELAKLTAKQTALKTDLDRLLGSKTGGKGRPTKGWLTNDVERAAAVIDAADWYYQRFDKKITSQKKAIELAVQFDAILVEIGERERKLFSNDMRGIQNSVSKGLKGLPDEKDYFIKK